MVLNDRSADAELEKAMWSPLVERERGRGRGILIGILTYLCCVYTHPQVRVPRNGKLNLDDRATITFPWRRGELKCLFICNLRRRV